MSSKISSQKYYHFCTRTLLFVLLSLSSYFLGIQGWSLLFIPFFLTLLSEEKKLPSFFLGALLLLQDVACGFWIGTHLILYGGFGLFILLQKRFILSHRFLASWLFFITLLLLLIACRQILGYGILSAWPPPKVLIYEITFVSLLFPLFAYFWPQSLPQKGGHTP